MDSIENELINRIIRRYDVEKYSKKKAEFIFGCMGSGKSTYIKQNLLIPDMFYVSTDDYSEEVMTNGFRGQDVYKTCRNIGIALTNHLLDNCVSMVLEGTGSHEDILQFMRRLKDTGYTINVHFIHCSLNTCIDRVKERNKTTIRKVPIDAIEKAYNGLWSTDMHKKIKELANEWKMVDSSK